MAEFVNLISDPLRTAIAQEYRNQALIGSIIMPVHAVGRSEFKYLVVDPKKEAFKAADAAVSATGIPNSIELELAELTGETKDWALQASVSNKKIEEAPEGYDHLDKLTETVTKNIWLGHEVRVMKQVKKESNYGVVWDFAAAGNKKLSDATADMPRQIKEALNASIISTNKLTLSNDIAFKLFTHASIIKAISASGTDSGIATPQAVADLLGLEEILVGNAFHNTSTKGANASLSRIWTGTMAGHFIDSGANPAMGEQDPTWGFTPQSYALETSNFTDGIAGTRGKSGVKVATEMNELVTAKDAGVFFKNIL